MVAHVIAILRIITGTVGLFFGYYEFFDNNFEATLDIITVTTVGIVGLLSFIGHLIFHKSDARRLGWESSTPCYQYEVGFAHLAFSLVAIFTFFGNWGFAGGNTLHLEMFFRTHSLFPLFLEACHSDPRICRDDDLFYYQSNGNNTSCPVLSRTMG